MPVELWFPVPFMLNEADAATREATHGKVHRYLASEAGKKAIKPSPVESVTTSYYTPEQSIFEDAGLVELNDYVFGSAAEFIKGMGLKPMALRLERAWINVFQPGAQEEMHSHDGSLLSGTYYVDAPTGCGSISFPDPIGVRRAHRAFTGTNGDDYLLAPAVAFEPKPGRLLMFESWVQHNIQCNKSNQARISIAFNFARAK